MDSTVKPRKGAIKILLDSKESFLAYASSSQNAAETNCQNRTY